MLLWWGFMRTALALVPVASLLAVELAPAGATLAQLSLVLGVVDGLVQALGLARWPFLVPMLARRHAEATTDPERTAVTVVFETTQVGLALVASPDASDLLGWLGAGLGVTLGVGSLEFVGRPGPRGWSVAERLVPIAYIGWSLWLLALGVALALGLG